MTGDECRFASGPFEGQLVRDAWLKLPSDWIGTSADRTRPFPILVKFIFTEQKLSVQVHPGDEYAAQHEKSSGGRGKTEMWYAMRARPGAEVMVGLRSGATKDKFRRAIGDGTAEDWLEHVPLKTGEAVFVPAGTVHTIGPGLVLCEIQEQSDITYRVYDYNRRDAHAKSRELHIDKALDVIRFDRQRGGKIEPLQIDRDGLAEIYFAACPFFATMKWEFSGRITADTSSEHFDLLVFLDGDGSIRWRKERADYAPMQVWMLPAALGPFELVPSSRTTLLRTYVPDRLEEFAGRLADQGISRDALSRLIHPRLNP